MKETYRQNWDYLSGQETRYWLLIATFLPGAWLLAKALVSVLHTDNAVFLAFLCWAVPLTVVIRRIQRFRCPRCGQWFCRPAPNVVKFYTSKCVHCGLPKWSAEDGTDAGQGAD